jgi:short-chain Z-isoprenyl diphosphate synthase
VTLLGYNPYLRHLRSQLRGADMPRHVGVIMDGNRRWARADGLSDVSLGHHRGATHLEEFLVWCERLRIDHVTVFACSTENLTRRSTSEIAALMAVIGQAAARSVEKREQAWRLHVVGRLDLLPDHIAGLLQRAVEASEACRTGRQLCLAIGYGGRQEIVEAVRRQLRESAAAGVGPADMARTLTDDDIGRHLDTAFVPDLDLVVRTSGEQRLSNFLLWQSIRARLYFCDAYWPAFREVDFLRALRDYAKASAA